MLFNHCISNPPYQHQSTSTNNTSVVKNIFHLFQHYADTYSDNSLLIYPFGRWFQQGGKGMKNFGTQHINNKHIYHVYHYETKGVFPNVNIGDDVCITHVSQAYDKLFFIYDDITIRKPGDSILPMEKKYITIVNKIFQMMSQYNLCSLTERKNPRTLYGIESTFVHNNKDKAIPTETTSRKPHCDDRVVRLLTNDKPGVSGRAHWYWIKLSDIPQGHEYIDTYHFVVKSAQYSNQEGIIDNGIIIPAGAAYGRSKVSIITVDTEEEITNFNTYIRTNFCKSLYKQSSGGGMTHICRFIPDLYDYTSDNTLIDWSKPIDKQIYNLCRFTQEEIDIIEHDA